jgi:hypothetical protein
MTYRERFMIILGFSLLFMVAFIFGVNPKKLEKHSIIRVIRIENRENCSNIPHTVYARTPKLPEVKFNDLGELCCVRPFWPFKSWTGKWTCIRGKVEAESTWTLYEDNK